MKSRLVDSIVLVLISIWLGWTVLVDFFVVPTVFRTISNFFEAGDLGIAVFSKLNNLELIVATIILGLLSLEIKKNKVFFILSILTWSIVMFYFSYLTPKIITLTELWKTAESTGTLGVSGIADIQANHQTFHKLYVGLDSVNLVLLSCLLGMSVWKKA
jgi:hypothetical protein